MLGFACVLIQSFEPDSQLWGGQAGETPFCFCCLWCLGQWWAHSRTLLVAEHLTICNCITLWPHLCWASPFLLQHPGSPLASFHPWPKSIGRISSSFLSVQVQPGNKGLGRQRPCLFHLWALVSGFFLAESMCSMNTWWMLWFVWRWR